LGLPNFYYQFSTFALIKGFENCYIGNYKLLSVRSRIFMDSIYINWFQAITHWG